MFRQAMPDARLIEAGRERMPRVGRRRHVLAGAACLLLASCRGVQATDVATSTMQMPDGPVAVDSVMTGAGGPHPAVIVLSGSRGFASRAYASMDEEFNRLGLDVFELHVLSAADIDAIARAGSARERIAYDATRMSSWTAAVRAAIDRLAADPRHAGRVGVLGVSLGAQIAATAVADRNGARALILVDGGYPGGHAPSPRTLPPLELIWGGDDRMFPVATARKLLTGVRDAKGRATLRVYEGRHDFFLQPASRQAQAAWRDAAEFFAARLD